MPPAPHPPSDARAKRVDARALGVALALAAVGIAGAAGAPLGRADPARALAWLALWAAPAGWIAVRLGLGRAALAVPGAWMLELVWLEASAARPLGAPAAGVAAFTGLFALGAGLASFGSARPWRGAGVLLGLGACLAGAPQGAGLAPEPWPPRATARLLDASPVAFVVESAGADWMRHPAVYAPAGTSRLGPGSRRAHEGVLAGCAVLLVGCALAVEGRRRVRRRGREPHTS